MAPTPNRPWLQDDRHELATARILDAAAALFEARGVGRVGMAEVAAAAGCSRATLYRYFENRDALRAAFVQREAGRIGALVAATVDPGAEPAERLVTAVTLVLREVRATPSLAAWFRAGDAGIAAGLAGSSVLIEQLGRGFLEGGARAGGTDEAGDPLRARWLVRVIVSLLTVPGAHEAEEQALLERFVAPVVLGPARTNA